MNKKTLVAGGMKSGKSRFAVDQARQYPGRRIFLATAEGFDDEMKTKIQRHREERGEGFVTIEEPLEPSRAVRLQVEDCSVVVLDCLTLWLNNLLRFSDWRTRLEREQQALFETITRSSADWLIVTNEVGSGIIPENALAREFAQELGRLNAELAQICDEVVWMTAGIPRWIKGGERHAQMHGQFTEDASRD